MRNFPKDTKEWSGDIIFPGAPLDDAKEELEWTQRTYGFRHPFVLKLLERGVLPAGCSDFSINVPVAGAITIKATYFVDREAFEASIRETYSEENAQEAAARTKENRQHAKRAQLAAKRMAAARRDKTS